MRRIRRRLAAMLTAVAVAAAILGGGCWERARVAYAVEFTVTEKSAVLYSNDRTKVYEAPDTGSRLVTTVTRNLPVQVTGITSNGWFRISLEGTYYVPGDGLEEKSTAPGAVITGTDIPTLTRGTFSFFKSSELNEFDSDDVKDMDANTYIKYLDSFLMGYAMPDYCILRDSGKFLKTVYDSEKQTDATVAAMTMQAYLIRYRNKYMSDSLAGPFRNEKDLKIALNRAIRYDIMTFRTVYNNSAINNDETKMKKAMENIIAQMKAEQGVSFTCKMEYGTYKNSDGGDTKGWIIEFTRQD
ncbi:MAG: SH3 domain-containing protein [Roseburia sp.]|nr:SH3 domain-containing protein [Roseburia sp.]